MPISEDVLQQEPQDIAERAADVGAERLDRSWMDILITGFIGGVEVSLGGLAAMSVLGAATAANERLGLYGGLALAGLVFPAGFLFVIVGRSELFTENFLIPVVAVLTRERTLRSLGELWLLSLLGNIGGLVLMAFIFTRPSAIGEPIRHGYTLYSAYKLSLPLVGVFLSAVLAGMVMTVLTWLLLAVRDSVGRVLTIFAAGYTLFATNLSHVVVSGAIILVGFRDAGASLATVVAWLAVATAGNLVGGVGFVTVFRVAQVREKQRQS